jgi:hypothetical protein
LSILIKSIFISGRLLGYPNIESRVHYSRFTTCTHESMTFKYQQQFVLIYHSHITIFIRFENIKSKHFYYISHLWMMWMSCISVCIFSVFVGGEREMRKTRSLSRVETRAHTQTNNRCDDLKRIKLMTVKLCVLILYENFVNKSRQRDTSERDSLSEQKLI